MVFTVAVSVTTLAVDRRHTMHYGVTCLIPGKGL